MLFKYRSLTFCVVPEDMVIGGIVIRVVRQRSVLWSKMFCSACLMFLVHSYKFDGTVGIWSLKHSDCTSSDKVVSAIAYFVFDMRLALLTTQQSRVFMSHPLG